MSGDKVLEILTPKIYKQFISNKDRKDPRLCASITTKEIKAFGEKIDIQ